MSGPEAGLQDPVDTIEEPQPGPSGLQPSFKFNVDKGDFLLFYFFSLTKQHFNLNV